MKKKRIFNLSMKIFQMTVCEDCYILLKTLDEILLHANHSGTEEEQQENV